MGTATSLDRYAQLIDKLAEHGSNNFINNSSPLHSAIIIRKIFDQAKGVVYIATDNFRPDIWDNAQISLKNAIASFMRGGTESSVEILLKPQQMRAREMVIIEGDSDKGLFARLKSLIGLKKLQTDVEPSPAGPQKIIRTRLFDDEGFIAYLIKKYPHKIAIYTTDEAISNFMVTATKLDGLAVRYEIEPKLNDPDDAIIATASFNDIEVSENLIDFFEKCKHIFTKIT